MNATYLRTGLKTPRLPKKYIDNFTKVQYPKQMPKRSSPGKYRQAADLMKGIVFEDE